ncbi:MAG TPA: hypothetical protein PLQ56_16490 [Aggregatilineales bacterium]|nr:hypothetical protein [Aggregatilineales bacterium]
MTPIEQRESALVRYHAAFDNALYTAIGEFIASNLNAERNDARVVAMLTALQDASLELCGHPDQGGASHRLAVNCGQSFLSRHTLEAISHFLQRFSVEEDLRNADFEGTAGAMVTAYIGRNDLQTAATHANGVHSWQGRAAYHLLVACDFLTLAAIQLLAHGDASYIREKLKHGLERITSALNEGVRHSEQPAMFDLSNTYFPSDADRHD